MCAAGIINGTTGSENYYKRNIMPQEKSSRQIVREEIERAQKLGELDAKHDAGEISDFEYKIQKFMLTAPQYNEQIEEIKDSTKCYSTTA